MPFFSERRLTRYTLDEINQQRKDAGAQTVAAPLSTRQVAQQATYQDQVHKNALGNNQLQAGFDQTGTALLDNAAATQQSSQYKPAPDPNAGVIEQSRNARLDAANATDQQRAANQQNLKGIANAGYGVTSEQKRITARLEALNAGGDALPSGVTDPAIAAQVRAANATEAQALQQQLQGMQQQDKQKAGDSANSSAASQASDPVTSGMQALLTNLPPEAQALAPLFENILHSISQGQEDNAKMTDALLNGGQVDINGNPVQVQGINSVYDQMDQKIKDMEQGYTAMQDGIQGMLDKASEQQDKAISEQEDAAKDRLAWTETQMLRQAAKEKQAAVDSHIARLALTGGFGSDGGLREIEETRMSYENRMDDIRTEFGVQKTELAAKFTGLYLESSNDHLTKSIANIKDTAAALERIAGQSLSTKQARSNAEQGILKNFVNSQTSSRKEYAGALKDYATQMQTTINESRDDKRAQEQAGWQRLEWVAQTYGSDAPQDLLDSIGKQLPGVDVKGVASQMTLAEMKKKGTGSGGGGLGGFASYQKEGTGEPPSFDNFLKDKEKQAFASGAVKFDTSAKAMADYHKEYDARQSVEKQQSPNAIVDRFEQRSAAQNLSAPVYKRTAALIDEYLKNGQYQQAADIVDNIGDDIPSTESVSFQQALNARFDVLKLHEAMQALPMQGPISGRLQDLPYNDANVRVQNLITQTVPNLARGIFREVGVLTDQDVERYTKTLENPNLTVQQAQNAYNDLTNKVNTSMQNQLDVWDAANKRTKGFKQIFNAVPATAQPQSNADEDYANSILLGK